jgi:hypothetical protein
MAGVTRAASLSDNSVTSAKILDGTIATADLAASARPGLVFVKSGTCSALAGGLSIDDCFSATYNNYRIIVSGVCNTFSGLEARLRVSSTDATTAYASQCLRASSTTVSAFVGTSDPASAFVGAITTSQSIITVDVSGPFLAQQTAFLGFAGAGAPRIDFASAVHTTGTSYTGISFFPDVNQPARTLTITARVYGYANS